MSFTSPWGKPDLEPQIMDTGLIFAGIAKGFEIGVGQHYYRYLVVAKYQYIFFMTGLFM